jgi:hypothetical protein
VSFKTTSGGGSGSGGSTGGSTGSSTGTGGSTGTGTGSGTGTVSGTGTGSGGTTGSGTGTGGSTGGGTGSGQWVPEANPQMTWAPVGSLPLSDAAASALVTPEPEQRPSNTAANDYLPTDAQLQAFYASTPGFLNDPLRQYVTGRPGISNPSTDDLIQWAAHKWGIPEDWIRADAVVESDWNQSKLGDLTTVSSSLYQLFPPQAQAANSQVYESMGIMEVKWAGNATCPGAGTEPLRWESTAFNLDFYAAYVRWLYDGYTVRMSWIPNIYKGDPWQSIGGWFGSGGNAAAQQYISWVQNQLAAKPWLQPGF